MARRWLVQPDLVARFLTDLAYQERVLRLLVVRSHTTREMARAWLPYVADPVWD